MAGRGSYPKGIAKREEILAAALQLISTKGYNAATIRELADSVGLSKTGLLHHFGTKEELFAAVLEQRDVLDAAALQNVADARDVLPEVLHHNATVGGLIELYARLMADSTPDAHVTHGYFANRFEYVTGEACRWIRQLQADGVVTDRIDARTLAVLLHAAMNGLQSNWLFDRNLDMEAPMRALFDLLDPGREDDRAGSGQDFRAHLVRG